MFDDTMALCAFNFEQAAGDFLNWSDRHGFGLGCQEALEMFDADRRCAEQLRSEMPPQDYAALMTEIELR